MYRCKNCGCKFEEPKELRTSYESYYGVGDLFSYHTPLTLELCPKCNNESIEEIKEDDEEEENN